MKTASFVLIIGLFLLACACASAQEKAPIYNGLIKGRITDTATPRPNNLPGVTVTVQSNMLLRARAKTAITDMAGNYEIINLPAGEYVVTTSKPGYDYSRDYVTVTPGGEAFHDVRLYKTDSLVTYFRNQGPIRWPLALCSLLMWLAIGVTVAYVIHRIIKLRKSKSEIGKGFISRVIGPLQNGDMMGAISICGEVGGLANILRSVLLQYAELSEKGEVTGEGVQQAIWQEKVQEAAEKAGAKAKRELRFHWWLIAAMCVIIGGLSLLYGRLGANMGIVIALKVTADPQLSNTGISETWLANISGLAIAITCANLCAVAFIIYLIYERKINALISRTQQTFLGMVNSLSTTQVSGKIDQ